MIDPAVLNGAQDFGDISARTLNMMLGSDASVQSVLATPTPSSSKNFHVAIIFYRNSVR